MIKKDSCTPEILTSLLILSPRDYQFYDLFNYFGRTFWRFIHDLHQAEGKSCSEQEKVEKHGLEPVILFLIMPADPTR